LSTTSASGFVLRGDESELFARLHPRLVRSVAQSVVAPDATVEDACSFAWTQFLRHQPVRSPELLSWLKRVAIRECWHLTALDRRHDHLEDLSTHAPVDGDGWETIVPQGPPLEDQAALRRRAHEGLQAIAALPARQRDFITMHVAGHSYAEIGRRHDATYTNVNRHIARARKHLRDAAA
jgi:RNA polymerase sigma factor (sigma-70 family)